MIQAVLRTLVESITGRTDMSSVINDALSFALDELGQRHDFKDMTTEDSSIGLATDDLSFTLPTGTKQVLELRIIDSGDTGSVVVVKDKRWITDLWPNISGDTSGTPQFAYEEGRSMFLQPKADGVYDVVVTVVRLVGMDLNSDTADNPISGSDGALVSYASGFIFDAIQLFEEARAWKQRFEQEARKLIKYDKRRPARLQHLGSFSGYPQDLASYPSSWWVRPPVLN